jgi:hypothetical protein
MKKRIEEELAKLAFGDVESSEAVLLEHRTKTDPDAARTFETYCRMKEELRSLSQDVPEDQLSKERLRQAILARGLKDHPVAPRFGWVWVPAATAAIAFGLFFLKGQMPLGPNPAPVIVDNSLSGAFEPAPGVGVHVPDPLPSSNGSSVERSAVVSSAPATQVAVGESVRTRRSLRDITDRSATTRVDIADTSMSDGLASLPSFARTGESESSREAVAATFDFGSAMEESAPAPSEPARTIVDILPITDSDTGTLRATEVENTANVVVGG